MLRPITCRSEKKAEDASGFKAKSDSGGRSLDALLAGREGEAALVLNLGRDASGLPQDAVDGTMAEESSWLCTQ